MKILWISKSGDTLGLAMKVAKDGNDVEFAVQDSHVKLCGEGLINKVKDWRQALAKDKLIIFDMNGNGRAAGALRKQGYSVFGGHELADRLEMDRTFGTTFMNTAGIHTPKTTTFTDFSEAIQFVRKTGQKYVFKPDGNMDCSMTYVAYNDEAMIHFLETQKKAQHKHIEFELQTIQKGVEASIEGLFDGDDWVDGWFNITLESKKTHTGDLGPACGCSMDVVKALKEQRDAPIVKKTLLKVTPALQQAGYRGFVDINCIYFNGTPFGLEWTPRFGINAIFTLAELVQTPLAEVFDYVAKPKVAGSPLKPRLWSIFSASVSLHIPKKPKIEHRLIQNVQSFDHLMPMNMFIDDEGRLCCTDEDETMGVVTNTGATIEEASENCYKYLNKVENFGINDIEYRIDLGEQEQEDYNTLTRWGLIKD